MSTIRDENSDYICPYCRSKHDLTYVEIPESLRTYTQGGVEYTDHFGPSRDYTCRNCDHEWNQSEAAA